MKTEKFGLIGTGDVTSCFVTIRFMKQELIEATGKVEMQKVTKVTCSPEVICD
jgi:hypothetical protein